MKHKISRRFFIGAGAAGTFGLCLFGLRARTAWMQERALARRLFPLFAHPAEVARVGNAYFGLLKGRPSVRSLARGLYAGVPPDRLEGMSDRDILLHLKERMEMDFADGRTLLLNGWVVSQTEASLCGLLTRCGQGEPAS